MPVVEPQRILRALAGSAVLIALAGLFWAASLISSWNAECPGGGYEPTGLDKGVSLLPPGASCVMENSAGRGTNYWFDAHPWLWTTALVLVVSAAAVVFVGVLMATRGLRTRGKRIEPRASA